MGKQMDILKEVKQTRKTILSCQLFCMRLLQTPWKSATDFYVIWIMSDDAIFLSVDNSFFPINATLQRAGVEAASA